MSFSPPISKNDDEDFDIYADLSDANTDVNRTDQQLNQEYQALKEQLSKVKADLENLRKSNRDLQESNRNLSCNVSALYKTALSEIKRKDKAIFELKRELDNVIFRRADRKSTFDRLKVSSNDPVVQADVEQSKLNGAVTNEDGASSVSVVSSSSEAVVESTSVKPLSISKSLKEVRSYEGMPIEMVSEESKNEHTLQEAKTQNIIKAVPKKRKIEFLPSSEDNFTVKDKDVPKQVDTTDRNNEGVVFKKKSVWERLGYKENSFKVKQDSVEASKGMVDACTKSNSLNILTDKMKTKQPLDQHTETYPSTKLSLISNKENSDSTTFLNGKHCTSKGTQSQPESDDHLIGPNSNESASKTKEEFLNFSNDGKVLSTSKEDHLETGIKCNGGNVDTFLVAQDEQDPEVVVGENETKKNISPTRINSELKLCSEDLKQLPFFHPPLPKNEPAPLPPLPVTTPPPTPTKYQEETVKAQIKDCLKENSQNAKDISDISEIKGTECSKDPSKEKNFEPLCALNSLKPSISVNAAPVQNLSGNLLMQCSFKPRRRAKSVIVVEDTTDVNQHQHTSNGSSASCEPDSNPKPATVRNGCKSPEVKLKHKYHSKKHEVHENRPSSSFRPHQNQRSAYSSRYLSSVKSSAHMPERRSPSELLSGRSGRIERLPHEDRIRVRLRDSRSRSLSPQGRRPRQEFTRSINGRFQALKNRRILTSCQNDRGDSGQNDRSDKPDTLKRPKSLSLKKRHQNNSEGSERVSKPEEISRPVPKETFSRSEMKETKASYLLPGSDNQHSSTEDSTLSSIPLSKTNDTSLVKSSLIASKLAVTSSASHENNKFYEESIIVVRRRPRSSIRLENSENSPNTSTINLSQENCKTLIHEQSKFSPLIEKLQHSKSPQGIQNTQNGSHSRSLDTTPLYFREQGPTRSFSEESDHCADFFFDADESPSSADSDVSYNPKSSSKRAMKRKLPKRNVRQKR